MALEARAFWAEAEARLEPRASFGWQACGYLWLAHSAAVLERLKAGVELQNRLGIPSRILSAAEAAEVAPGLPAEAVAGASWCGEDGYFDRPQGVVEAFAEAAVRLGAEIVQADVARVEPGSLVLRGGDHVAAGKVVVAAGVETPRLLGRNDVPIVAEDRFM